MKDAKIQKTKPSKIVKDHKLKIEEIKKNSSSDVLHTIKRIKTQEVRIVSLLVLVILIVFCVSFYLFFSVIQDPSVDGNASGPLVISFSDDAGGMSDIVSFTEKTGQAESEGFYVVRKNFTITNESDNSSLYVVYLKDYLDMIDYDECDDTQYSKDNIFFSVDNSDAVRLSDVYSGGKYVIKEGKVSGNDVVSHEVQMWITDYNGRHYHGQIVVEYLK